MHKYYLSTLVCKQISFFSTENDICIKANECLFDKGER